jgi:hypothetical protein
MQISALKVILCPTTHSPFRLETGAVIRRSAQLLVSHLEGQSIVEVQYFDRMYVFSSYIN